MPIIIGGQHFCSAPGCLAHPGCSCRLYHFVPQDDAHQERSNEKAKRAEEPTTFAICSDHFNEHNYHALHSEGNVNVNSAIPKASKNPSSSGARLLFIPLKPLTLQPAGLDNPLHEGILSISPHPYDGLMGLMDSSTDTADSMSSYDDLDPDLMDLNSSTDTASESSFMDTLEIAREVSVIAEQETLIRKPENVVIIPQLVKKEDVKGGTGRGDPRGIVKTLVRPPMESKMTPVKKRLGRPPAGTKVLEIRDGKTYLEVFCCTECSFWARSRSMFHSHMVGKHSSEYVFRCSGCPYGSNQRISVWNHIKHPKMKMDIFHFNAMPINSRPIPSHQYLGNLRPVLVTVRQQYGMLSDNQAEYPSSLPTNRAVGKKEPELQYKQPQMDPKKKFMGSGPVELRKIFEEPLPEHVKLDPVWNKDRLPSESVPSELSSSPNPDNKEETSPTDPEPMEVVELGSVPFELRKILKEPLAEPAKLDPLWNKDRLPSKFVPDELSPSSNPKKRKETGPMDPEPMEGVELGPTVKPIQSDPEKLEETIAQPEQSSSRKEPVIPSIPERRMEVDPPSRNAEDLRREVEACRKELRELEAAMEEGFRFINDPALVPSSDEEVQPLQAKLVDMREKEAVLSAILSGMETQKKKVIRFLGGGILPASAKEEIRFLQKTDEDLAKRLQKGRQLQDSLHQSLDSMRKYLSDLLSSRKEVKELLVLQKKRILAHAALKERLASLCLDLELVEIHRIRQGMLSQLKSSHP